MTDQSNPVSYLTPANNDLPNPFRAGSKKHASFEEFKKGGDRNALLDRMKGTGVEETTARTWLSIFRVYARGVRSGRQARGE
jgi:hypothetical protein